MTLAERSFISLKEYVEAREYKGWDPYDGLSSKLFQHSPLRHSYWARLAFIQFFKRSPLNFRTLAGVPRVTNPKGLGLFLSGYAIRYRESPEVETLARIHFLIDKIRESVSPGYAGACWGYPFDWQARAFFQPRGTPTVVATCYVACALLDVYDITRNDSLLSMARSACEFVRRDLNRTSGQKDEFCFSYSPLDRTQVYNASLLGSRLLARVYSYTAEKELLDDARKSVAYCSGKQREDGSWTYGVLPFHQWIDSFHTGFNLECLHDYALYTGDSTFKANFDKGLSFYLSTFFTADGRSKYYHDRLYPIDIHAPAQLIILLAKTGMIERHRELADRVMTWTVRNMQSDQGYFYYQLKPWANSKIAYMRWAQAWMFHALAAYLNTLKQ